MLAVLIYSFPFVLCQLVGIYTEEESRACPGLCHPERVSGNTIPTCIQTRWESAMVQSKLGLADEDYLGLKEKKSFHVEHDETLSRRHSSLPRSLLRGRRGFNASRFLSLFFLPEKY